MRLANAALAAELADGLHDQEEAVHAGVVVRKASPAGALRRAVGYEGDLAEARVYRGGSVEEVGDEGGATHARGVRVAGSYAEAENRPSTSDLSRPASSRARRVACPTRSRGVNPGPTLPRSDSATPTRAVFPLRLMEPRFGARKQVWERRPHELP